MKHSAHLNTHTRLVKLYRKLVCLYPADIRQANAQDMVDVLQDTYEVELRTGGLFSATLYVALAFLEVPIKASIAHWNRHSKNRDGTDPKQRIVDRKPSLMETVGLDFRHACRALRKRPLFTIVAVATLGLGIGFATAMFSVIDGVLLERLPYHEPGRLVTAWMGYPNRGQYVNFTDDQYNLWRENNTLFQDVAMYNASAWGHGTLTGEGRPERISLGTATASLLPVLGVAPGMGRWFTKEEEGMEPGGAAPVAVISSDFWTRPFAARHDVLGRTFELDGITRTIVGVLPEDFRLRWLTESPLGIREVASKQVWLPFGQSYDCIGCGSSMYQAVGRLRPGVTHEQAAAETLNILESTAFYDDMNVRLVPRHQDETRGLGTPLILLLAATGLLLLIACGNIATLSLGEMEGRQRELTTRSALGAGCARIVRQLLTESLVIGLLGSATGILLALAGTRGLLLLAPPIPRIDQVGVNGIALAFAVALGIMAGLVFGTVPSILASRTSIGSLLRSAGRTSTVKARRFQKSVVTLEVALTAVILVTGGLLTRSLSQLLSVDPGFDVSNLATVHVSLPDSRYETQESHAAFVNEVLRELEAIPGVQARTAANNLPFPGTTAGWGVRGENTDPDAPRLSAKLFHVTPGFHEAMGIRVVEGRAFTSTDGPDAPSVALISEEFARRMWPGTSPIGLRVRYPWTTVTVVGIVQDVRRETLGSAPELVFYVPYSQFTRPDVSFAVRTFGDPAPVVPRMRNAVWSVDEDLAITHSGTMDALISRSAADERYRTILMAAFGLLASTLAAVGVFGVTARAVSLRTREMGIRMALGQRQTGMVANILRGSLMLGGLGIVAGVAIALWASKALSGLLFGIESSDPITYATVASSLLVLCLVASYLPARRIARVDPVDVLKAD